MSLETQSSLHVCHSKSIYLRKILLRVLQKMLFLPILKGFPLKNGRKWFFSINIENSQQKLSLSLLYSFETMFVSHLDSKHSKIERRLHFLQKTMQFFVFGEPENSTGFSWYDISPIHINIIMTILHEKVSKKILFAVSKLNQKWIYIIFRT